MGDGERDREGDGESACSQRSGNIEDIIHNISYSTNNMFIYL